MTGCVARVATHNALRLLTLVYAALWLPGWAADTDLKLEIVWSHWDPGTGRVKVAIKNNYQQAVTGYSLITTTRFADGQASSSGLDEDFVGSIVNESPERASLLDSASVRTTVMHVDRKDGTSPLGVEVKVAAVVLADGAAFGDEDSIERIFAYRRTSRDQFGRWLSVLEDPAAPKSSEARLKYLRARVDAWMKEAGPGGWIGDFHNFVVQATARFNSESLDLNPALKYYAEQQKRRLSAFEKHSSRK